MEDGENCCLPDGRQVPPLFALLYQNIELDSIIVTKNPRIGDLI